MSVTKNEDVDLEKKNEMGSKTGCNGHIPLKASQRSQAAVNRVDFRGINIDIAESLCVSVRKSVHGCF
jgi:hypothetical protein